MADDPARSRFFTLQAVRATGLAFVIVGLAVLNAKLAWPRPIGVLAVLIGLFDALFLPTILARRWKSPNP